LLPNKGATMEFNNYLDEFIADRQLTGNPQPQRSHIVDISPSCGALTATT